MHNVESGVEGTNTEEFTLQSLTTSPNQSDGNFTDAPGDVALYSPAQYIAHQIVNWVDENPSTASVGALQPATQQAVPLLESHTDAVALKLP